MAYNIGYPYYQPMQNMTQPLVGTQMSVPQAPAQNNGIIWVQGESGAKSYLVAPNTTVQLWDSESQTIYLKSADASGMPSMKVIDYTIRDTNAPQGPAVAPIQLEDYVTHNELSAMEERIQKQIERLNNRKDGKQNG